MLGNTFRPYLRSKVVTKCDEGVGVADPILKSAVYDPFFVNNCFAFTATRLLLRPLFCLPKAFSVDQTNRRKYKPDTYGGVFTNICRLP
jgi:hypothetical protein